MTKESIDLFKSLIHTTKTAVRTIFARCGMGRLSEMTGPQFGLMMNLHDKGPLSPSELCENMFVTRPNITGMISRLKKLGLVERRRLTSDRRCLKIGLTQLGHEKIEAILPVWKKAANECLSKFSADDRHSLTHLLNKLREAINTQTKTS